MRLSDFEAPEAVVAVAAPTSTGPGIPDDVATCADMSSIQFYNVRFGLDSSRFNSVHFVLNPTFCEERSATTLLSFARRSVNDPLSYG